MATNGSGGLSAGSASGGFSVSGDERDVRIVTSPSGKVSRYNSDWEFLDFKVISGCSGGGIFNEKGELVSVVWGGYLMTKKEAPLKSVAEKLEDIKKFLKNIGLEEIIRKGNTNVCRIYNNC